MWFQVSRSLWKTPLILHSRPTFLSRKQDRKEEQILSPKDVQRVFDLRPPWDNLQKTGANKTNTSNAVKTIASSFITISSTVMLLRLLTLRSIKRTIVRQSSGTSRIGRLYAFHFQTTITVLTKSAPIATTSGINKSEAFKPKTTYKSSSNPHQNITLSNFDWIHEFECETVKSRGSFDESYTHAKDTQRD